MTARGTTPGRGTTRKADAAAREIASLRDRLQKALADVERAEAALAAARTELDLTRDQIRTMRLSRAWRLTAPLRRFVRRVTHGESW